MSQPPIKRSRSFFIDQLLDLEPSNQSGGGGRETRKDAKDYVKKLGSSDIEHVTKFNYLKAKSRFSIEDVPADPEGLLGGIFQHCMDEAIAESRERGMEPDHLGCTISSNLLSSDIWIPVRKITPDTINTILNRFMEVAQSKERDGVTLWGEPFSVSVTTVNREGLTKKQLIGAGPKKLAPVHHRINDQCLIKINNKDGKCLFYALQATLMRNIGEMQRWEFRRYLLDLHGFRGRFQRDVEQLMADIGAPDGQPAYDAEIYVPRVVDHWNAKFRGKHRIKTFIFGSNGHYKPLFKYGLEEYDTPILLYYDGVHFDGVQKTGNLFGMPYCLRCEKTYHRAAIHNKDCKARCLKCSRIGPTFPCKYAPGQTKKCQSCKKIFFNDDCYRHHLSTNFCAKSKECEECGLVWDVADNTKNGRQGHQCQERFCATCQSYHDPKRGCYISPLEPNSKREAKQWRLVVFDLETMQHSPADPNSPANGKRKHEPNFIAASVACPKCISSGSWKESLQGKTPCNVCGEHRNIAFCQQPFHETAFDKEVINRHPLMAFVKWILYELPIKYDTVAFSHFGGRFDMVLVFRELYLEGLNPSMIRKGNRLFEMTAKRRRRINPEVVFRDSWNLIPVPLATMVPMFDLDVQDKPWFPHLCNRPDNYGKQIYPKKKDYLASGFLPEKRKAFDRWYEEHKNEPFFLDEALARGYDSAGANQSNLAFKFMNWYAKKHGVEIQNADSVEGEKKIGNYQLDGWIETEQKGLEIHGCAWHACPSCWPDPNHSMPSGKTAGKIREKNKERMDYIRRKVPNIEVYWECQIQKMLKKDKEMKKSFDDYNREDMGPLDIRACFMGGRTGPWKLFHTAAPGEKISYYDFTSLYPYINFVTRYPIGHPIVHILNEEVEWSEPGHNRYPLALLKVIVVPPRKIDVPILPVKVSDRLCFPCCMTCCKQFPHGGVIDDYTCNHTDAERSFICSCTSLELEAALEDGYVVTKVLRVLEYQQSDDKLFRPYISELMREKMHASGFDEGIRGNREAEDEFIKECKREFDISIDRDKMIPNKGKRAFSKLMLNNLWGRFSLRNFGLSQTLITDDPSELGSMLDNKSIDISSIDELTPETILISYIQKREWVEEHACSNVVISLFTTSAARVHLLRSMQKVVRAEGCELLYTDTDSLIFVHPEGRNPLKIGPHLGQLTDEFQKHTIVEYCSGGSKQYGLKMKRKGAGADEPYEYVLKVRGITLSYDVIVKQGLHYESFKQS